MASFYRQLTHFHPMVPEKRQHHIGQKKANEVTVYANLLKIKRIGAEKTIGAGKEENDRNLLEK